MASAMVSHLLFNLRDPSLLMPLGDVPTAKSSLHFCLNHSAPMSTTLSLLFNKACDRLYSSTSDLTASYSFLTMEIEDVVIDITSEQGEQRADDLEPLTKLGEHLISRILEGAPAEEIKELIKFGAPLWYQNESEGTSPLHAAAYSQSAELVKLLLDGGAVWNAVDHLGYTAGEIALSFNDEKTYITIRDAGIRAELLLGVLSKTAPSQSSSALLLRVKDESAFGSTDVFLSSKLRFTTDNRGQEICMLNVQGEEIGVMMGWERHIMAETVRKLCTGHENRTKFKVLNIGFGLGIIDTLFQSLPDPPALHVIIEPHPDVLQHMRDQGWYAKKGVQILEGKWQEFIESEELLGFGGFDVVFTDTFSEDYITLRQLFESLPDLIAGPESRFSFFNGLGATNPLFYDVYSQISDLHLSDVGFDVEWSDVDVSAEETEERWAKSRVYFSLPFYRLPICRMKMSL